jgi:hypothetical protein
MPDIKEKEVTLAITKLSVDTRKRFKLLSISKSIDYAQTLKILLDSFDGKQSNSETK